MRWLLRLRCLITAHRRVWRTLDEVILYGDLPMCRRDVYVLAAEHLGDDDLRYKGAEWSAFKPPVVEGREPLSLEAARRICDDRWRQAHGT